MSGERRGDRRPATLIEFTLIWRKPMSSWFVATLFCIGVLAVGGCAVQPTPSASAQPDDKDKDKKPAFRAGAVRYQVKDVDRSVKFYTKHLGFELDKRYPAGAAFAAVSNGSLTLWLSGPKSSGSRAMPDRRKQEPGGWNRIVLEVEDLKAHVAALKKAGLRFRNEIEVGPGGKQIQLEDPDGNPVELFEPAK
jgi:glyoxylase I family protein